MRASFFHLCMLTVFGLLRTAFGQSAGGESADRPVRYSSYSQMVERMKALASKAPDLVELWSAQDRFGVASPGACGQEPCKHWFITLTNKTAPVSQQQPVAELPPGVAGVADQDRILPLITPITRRPQIFLSGNLHGDEVVGPMTLIHLLEDLVAARLRGTNPWLNHLVDERVVVAIPVTNPIGYFGRVREENGMDPNRDFPYSIADPTRCMRTTTARAVNEAWRNYLFTLGVTFHGGMQSISYEWGAPNHSDSDSRSPDDVSQRAVGLVMRETAGAFQGSKYPVDRTNRLVYPVDGGMEDWAYAGSWEPDKSRVRPCTPTTYNGYPREKTVYTDAVLRALNMLVEAADDKTPAEGALGTHGDPFAESTWALSSAGGAAAAGTLAAVLAVEGPGDGHVPRNLRLVLATIDIAAPYLTMTRWRTEVKAKGGSTAESLQRALVSTDGNDNAAAAGAYNGPRSCYYQSGASSPSCLRWKDEFKGGWFQLGDASSASASLPSVASDAVIAAEVGWDVGGGLNVDATGALAGSWDPRVPPSLLTEAALVGSADNINIDLSPSSVPTSFISTLREKYGFDDEQEALRFGRYVRAWQLLLLGRMEVEQMPSELLLYHSSPVKNTQTRWAFPNGAEGISTSPEEQAMLQSLQPAETTEAVVKGIEQGASSSSSSSSLLSPLANPLTAVSGAPDLMRHPFVTRYSQCFSAAGPAPYGKQLPLPPAPIACSTSAPPGSGSGSGSGSRALLRGPALEQSQSQGEAGRQASDVSDVQHHGVQAYFTLSYAVVDKQWGSTGGQPVSPAGHASPQGHLANARTNPAWRFENNGYKVEGRKLFVSRPKFFAVSGPVATATAPAARPSCADSNSSGGGGGGGSSTATIDTSDHPIGEATSSSSSASPTTSTTPAIIKVAGLEVSTGNLVAYSIVVTVLFGLTFVAAVFTLRAYYRSHRVAGFAPLPLSVPSGAEGSGAAGGGPELELAAGPGSSIAAAFDDSDQDDDGDESDRAKLRKPTAAAAKPKPNFNNKPAAARLGGSSLGSGAGARPGTTRSVKNSTGGGRGGGANAVAPASLAFDDSENEDDE